MRSARPPRSAHPRLARRAFWAALLSGLGAMGALGLAWSGSFGLPGRSAPAMGWPALVLGSLVLLAALVALLRARRVASFLIRAREPFLRPLDEYESYEGAAGALAACPAPFRYRFALRWIVVPALLAVVGMVAAWSCAYFVVDATLSRFQVSWMHPALGSANAFASLLAFRIAAPRLSTWRLALSIYKSVTTGY